MTPALREELLGIRALAATLLQRVDEALGPPAPPNDLAKGKTPAAIVALVTREKRSMSPREIFDALIDAGRDVSEDAVYQACSRLAREGALRRAGQCRYDVPRESTS